MNNVKELFVIVTKATTTTQCTKTHKIEQRKGTLCNTVTTMTKWEKCKKEKQKSRTRAKEQMSITVSFYASSLFIYFTYLQIGSWICSSFLHMFVCMFVCDRQSERERDRERVCFK